MLSTDTLPVRTMAAALVLAVFAAWVPDAAAGPQLPPNPCPTSREGAPCLGVPDSPGDCTEPRCVGGDCEFTPVPDGRVCDDADGSSCTRGRCRAGVCQPNLLPEGSPCSDATPASCGPQACRSGVCAPAGAPDPELVARLPVYEVDAEAARPRVGTATAFTDCCILCGEQTLEALRPTPEGPERREADGRLPLRRKLCGQVTRYGVNDEWEDPRDILINIRPAQNFADFVAGFLNTEETRLGGEDRFAFSCNPGPAGQNVCRCDPDLCRQKADSKTGKVIHAEVTPADEFFGEDARFLPISDGVNNITLPAPQCGYNGFSNTLTDQMRNCINCAHGQDCQSELERPDAAGRDVCVYGVYAIDHGGHSASSHQALCCAPDQAHDHPEIHPFDAVWWPHPDANGWMFAVFQDDSNRYSFPSCGDNNGSDWSDAPRDITFRFPFRFPYRPGQGPQRACLRHVRTRSLKDGRAHEVLPLNVTTAALATTPEVKVLTGGRDRDSQIRLLEVIEQPGFEGETHVRVEGGLSGAFPWNEVSGHIVVRVAVGCSERAEMVCTPDEMDRYSPGSRHNAVDDMGSGFYYGELTFDCACP